MPQTFQLDNQVQVVQPLRTTYLLWYVLLDLVYSFGNLCADIVKSSHPHRAHDPSLQALAGPIKFQYQLRPRRIINSILTTKLHQGLYR